MKSISWTHIPPICDLWPTMRSNADDLAQKEEAIALVARAIRAGIFNDLGSGSNVDVAVITKAGTQMMRNYEMPVSLLSRPRHSRVPSLLSHNTLLASSRSAVAL